jgi:acyl-coenzyme A thioesterase PaaI-like protein
MLFDPMAAKANAIRQMWDRLSPLPGGSRLFTRMVGLAAPYTASIGAHVEVLRRGHSEVTLRDRRAVRNHLTCVHAVALANLAELAGNIAVAYSLPDDARFIVKKMCVEYDKKARGTIRAVCDCPAIESSARREYDVAVRLLDAGGAEVARATLCTLVGPKPGRA